MINPLLNIRRPALERVVFIPPADGQYAMLSGTSMATPHVAGLLLVRGGNLPTHGFVTGDPDGKADPIAGE